MGQQNDEWASSQSYGLDHIQTSTMAWYKVRTWHNDEQARGCRQTSSRQGL